MPAWCNPRAAAIVVGYSANPVADGVGDVLLGGVVVTGERDLILMSQRHDLAHIGRRVCLLIRKTPFEQNVQFGVGHAGAFAAIIVAQLAFVAKLALPRRVIHQRHQAHIRPPNQLLGFLDHARHRDFAAQVQEMIGTQQIGIARRCDRLSQHARLSIDLFGAVLAPDPQRIQHRGDP